MELFAVLGIIFFVCVIALIKPMPKIGLPTRKRALVVAGSTFATLIIGVIVVAIFDERVDADKTTTAPPSSVETSAPIRHDPVREEVIEIQASDLYRQYEENEVAADTKFKGIIYVSRQIP